MFADVEPPHNYVRDSSASGVHHADYLNRRGDHALCGEPLETPATLGQTGRPDTVCPDCEARLVEYHLMWWRERALAATAELDELRVKYRELTTDTDSQRRSSGSTPEDRSESREEPQRYSTAGQAEVEPSTFLGQARRELLELCRQFDRAVPYWRLKNTMQAFSDKLNTDERVLLAREVGTDSSLMRWCTKEVESLGWSVTGSPVQEESEAMWDAWTHDSYQTPKKNKWRLGRSRSHSSRGAD